jgi:septum site-determining protein MinD
MGKAIALHSYKGGTGKTILSLNLAALYASMGRDVCLLDLDLRAPSLHAAFKTYTPNHWINDYLNGSCEIEEILIEPIKRTGWGRLLVGLANPSTHAMREAVTRDRRGEMKALRRLLTLRSRLFKEIDIDYLVFDTSPGLQYSSINAIVCADVVLLITTTDPSDIEGTKRMISELYDLFEKKTWVIMNKIPFKTYLSDDCEGLLKSLTDTYSIPVLEAIPCLCDVLQAAGSQILVVEKPDHIFSKALERIAKAVKAM